MNTFYQSATEDGICTLAFIHDQIVSQRKVTDRDGNVTMEKGAWTELLFTTHQSIYDAIVEISHWGEGEINFSARRMVRVFAMSPVIVGGEKRIGHNIADYIRKGETDQHAVDRVVKAMVKEIRELTAAASNEEAA